jgi:hypothetical protein
MEETANSNGNELLPLQLHQPGPNYGEELQAKIYSNGTIHFQVSSVNHLNQRSK